MTTEERIKLIEQAHDNAQLVKDAIYKIVWEGQEAQKFRGEEHFDDMNKSEQIALVGILSDAHHLVESLTMYTNWFLNH